MSQDSEPLWNVATAAKYLNVAERTVRHLCSQNKIEHVRIGTGRGVIRFRPQDVRKYVERLLLDSQVGKRAPSGLNFD